MISHMCVHGGDLRVGLHRRIRGMDTTMAANTCKYSIYSVCISRTRVSATVYIVSWQAHLPWCHGRSNGFHIVAHLTAFSMSPRPSRLPDSGNPGKKDGSGLQLSEFLDLWSSNMSPDRGQSLPGPVFVCSFSTFFNHTPLVKPHFGEIHCMDPRCPWSNLHSANKFPIFVGDFRCNTVLIHLILSLSPRDAQSQVSSHLSWHQSLPHWSNCQQDRARISQYFSRDSICPSFSGACYLFICPEAAIQHQLHPIIPSRSFFGAPWGTRCWWKATALLRSKCVALGPAIPPRNCWRTVDGAMKKGPWKMEHGINRYEKRIEKMVKRCEENLIQ